jgi:hypothetical protein
MPHPKVTSVPLVPRPPSVVSVPGRTPSRALREGTASLDGTSPGMDAAPILVNMPGGELVSKLLPDEAQPMQREFSTLPEESMFLPGLDPDHPFQWTLGSYKVPRGTTLWLEDMKTAVLLPDPIDPHGYRFAEAGRFRGVLGFAITVNDRQYGDFAYELDPIPRPTARQEFETIIIPVTPSQAYTGAPVPATTTMTDRFSRAAAQSFASVAGLGTSLRGPSGMPPGPRNRAWVWTLEQDQTIAVRCVIYRRISAPIAGIYAMIAGHVLPQDHAYALSRRVRAR